MKKFTPGKVRALESKNVAQFFKTLHNLRVMITEVRPDYGCSCIIPFPNLPLALSHHLKFLCALFDHPGNPFGSLGGIIEIQ